MNIIKIASATKAQLGWDEDGDGERDVVISGGNMTSFVLYYIWSSFVNSMVYMLAFNLLHLHTDTHYMSYFRKAVMRIDSIGVSRSKAIMAAVMLNECLHNFIL